MIPLAQDFLKGSYPPLVTPFRDGEVDVATFERLVERQVVEGSHGVVVCGTSGEPSTLSVGERRLLLEAAVTTVAGRIPVVAATGSQSHAETVELTEHAASAGADAVMIVTPYYVSPPQRGIAAYFVDLARRVDVPVLMYHIPGRTAFTVTVPTLDEIAGAAPNFVGMKHASTDLGLVSDVLDHLGDEFRVLAGLEQLGMPMMAVGAAGLVNAVGNVAPRTVADLATAMLAGDLERGRQLHRQLNELNKAVFWDTNPIPVKCLMRIAGVLDTNEHRLPMVPATPELEQRLQAVAKNAGLID